MTAMRVRPRKKPGQKKPEPFVRLYCNGRNCMAHEDLHQTTFEGLSTWCGRNDWKVIHRGGHLFDHRCPHCARNLMAPPAYFERLHA